MKKRSLFIFFIVLFFLFCGAAVLAQTTAPAARPLEIEYPAFPKTPPPQTVETPVTEYVKYLYYFFIFTAGFFALGALVYASFRYVTSAGRPEAMKDAKDQISAALLGVLILVSSWIILNQINPQLVTFRLGPARPFIPSLSPGVLLCKERVDIMGAWNQIKESEKLNKEFETASSDRQKEIITRLRQISIQVSAVIASTTKYCWKVPLSGDIPDPFNDKVEWAYLIPSVSTTASAGNEYGAILYENTKFGGKSLAIYGSGREGQASLTPNLEPSEWAGIRGGKTIKDLKPSSVKPFILNYQPQPRPVWFVNLYELIDYNKADLNKKLIESPLPASGQAAKSSTVGASQKLGSLKIEGKFIVVFFKQSTGSSQSNNKPWEGDIDVFTESDTNLYDNLMGRWCGSYYPCAPGGLVVISGSIY